MQRPHKIMQFVWHLRRAYTNKQQSFYAPNFYGLEQFLSDLVVCGVIVGFKKGLNYPLHTWVEVMLRYLVNGSSAVCFVATASKPGCDVVVRYKNLKSEARNEPFSVGILRTAATGLTVTKKAIAIKSGGEYLIKIK